MSGEKVSFKHLCLIALDLTVINLSYVLTFIFRLGENVPSNNVAAFIRVAPWISMAAVLIFYIFGLYSEWVDQSLINVVYSMVFAVVSLNFLAIGLIYLTHDFAVPRSVSLLTPVLELMILMTVRLGIWYLLQQNRSARKALVVGANAEESMAVAKKLLAYT